MKRNLIIFGSAILITFVVSVAFFTLSDSQLIAKIPFTRELYTRASLTITGKSSILDVKINGEDEGQTPLELSGIDPGSYEITLTRKGSPQNFYEPATFFIELHPNTEAIVDIELGPENHLYGYVLYYNEAKTPKGEGSITFNSTPVDADIQVDGQIIGKTPKYSYNLSAGDHQITVSKSGHESVTVPVVISEGFNLNLLSYLMPIPIDLQLNETADESE